MTKQTIIVFLWSTEWAGGKEGAQRQTSTINFGICSFSFLQTCHFRAIHIDLVDAVKYVEIANVHNEETTNLLLEVGLLSQVTNFSVKAIWDNRRGQPTH